MKPAHEFSFEFDRAFIRAGLRRDYTWRAWAALLGYPALGIAASLVFPQFRWLLIGIFGVGGPLVAWLLMRRFERQVDVTLEHWQKLSPSSTIRFVLDDEGFAVEMPHGSSRYGWSGLRRLWRYPDTWLIEIVRKHSVLFPPDAASPEAREFLLERCRTAGVRV